MAKVKKTVKAKAPTGSKMQDPLSSPIIQGGVVFVMIAAFVLVALAFKGM